MFRAVGLVLFCAGRTSNLGARSDLISWVGYALLGFNSSVHRRWIFPFRFPRQLQAANRSEHY